MLIKKNILDLKYHRYLEKSHTLYNSLITSSLGVIVIVATAILSKQVKLSFEVIPYIIYPISAIWIIFIPLITFTRIKRAKVREELKQLDTPSKK